MEKTSYRSDEAKFAFRAEETSLSPPPEVMKKMNFFVPKMKQSFIPSPERKKEKDRTVRISIEAVGGNNFGGQTSATD